MMRRIAAAREHGPPCKIASSQRIECAAVYDGARVGPRTAQIPSASCAAMSLADTVALDQLVRAVRMRIAAAQTSVRGPSAALLGRPVNPGSAVELLVACLMQPNGRRAPIAMRFCGSYPGRMIDGRRHELEQFALAYRDDEIEVRRAIAALDERRDGEPVTRVTLLVTDPTAETWDVGRVRDLRHALGRHAEELGLPPVSLTLVPESEAQVVEAFAQ